ncbi:MAG TPA: ABC transporter ATP-binding protein [Sphingobium sp.]
MNNIWRVIRFIPEYRGRLTGILGVGAAVGAIGTAIPYLYKHIVDVIAGLAKGALTAQAAGAQLGWLVAGFIALRLTLVLFTALQDKQSDDLWLDTVSSFRQRVFDNMTILSMDYFEGTRVGEVVDRFGTITQITMWLFTLTEGVLANMIQILFILALLLWKAPVAGLAMAAVVLGNILLSRATVRRTAPWRRGWQRLAGQMTGLLAEMVSHIATVRSFGGEAAVKSRYDQTQADWRVTRGTLHVLEWRANLTLGVVNCVGLCAVVASSAYGAFAGALGPGDLLLVLTLSNMLFATIAPVSRQFNQAGDIDSSAERLVELLEVERQVDDTPDATLLEAIHTIEFRDVSFTYRHGKAPAVDRLSFQVEPGQTLALVGRSGSGKSTIIKLLMRFYDPTAGLILINGRDIRGFTQQSLRKRLGVVMQDVALFNDSIAENIAFAVPDAPLDQIARAAQVAQASEFIERLPDGYQTLVGERGTKLSGGEKQRIAIARAVLRDPDLVILDEATSALDSEAEAEVQQALDRLLSGRTAIVIAHRLSTIRNADQILVFQQGQVVETGTHESLLARDSGHYARAIALQSGRAREILPLPGGDRRPVHASLPS